MNVVDAALDEFVEQEAALLASIGKVVKTFDRALIKLGNSSFYLSFHTVIRSRGDSLRAAAAATAYALDEEGLLPLTTAVSTLLQDIHGFLSQVCVTGSGATIFALASFASAIGWLGSLDSKACYYQLLFRETAGTYCFASKCC